MTTPFYVAPEQVMQDRADFARKGIAKGRSLVSVICEEGTLICTENQSATLRKISEIYDRIAFGGVGRYNEFDQLRIAGVRHADLKGYQYSREDVDAQSLANNYAQMLGQIFTHEMKPMEVEILVAEVGDSYREDQLFHINYDGTVRDENNFAVLGGDPTPIREKLEESFREAMPVVEGLKIAVEALSGEERELSGEDVEAAILERANPERAFRRLSNAEIQEMISSGE